MAKRLKMTGFARFIIVMIILAPLAFIGASLYNGEDPVEKFNEIIGETGKVTQVVQQDQQTPEQDRADVTSVSEQIKQLEQRIEQLENDNKELKRKLDEKDQEILYLKDQIKQLK